MKSSIWCVLLVAILFVCCGCKIIDPTPKPPNQPTNNEKPEVQVVTKLIYKTNWLATAAIIGIAASAAAFVTGQSYALPMFAACSALLTTILSIAQYAKWIAVAGMVVSISIFIYVAMKKNRTTKKLEGALSDVVTGVEKLREKFLNTVVAKKEVNDTLRSCQSDDTVALVESVKKEIDITELPGSN